MSGQVIFIDDEAAIRQAVQQWLELSGFQVRTFSRAREALTALDRDFPGVLISDVRMPDLDGLGLLEQLVALDADLPVIMVTGHGDVPMAVQALRQGAYDFIEKPFTPERLLDSVRRAMDKRRLVCENRQLREQFARKGRIESQLLGVSRAMVNLRRQVLELAGTDVNVLIRGETGSGKEQVARCLHDFSPRAGGPFVALNCAAIPETLIESELFGHVKGAFTGAVSRRRGLLELAHTGTLFLDEVGDMSPGMQTKLLRFLQDGEFRPVGSSEPVRVDVRILAASNRPLFDLVEAGRFREDLFYRLNVLPVNLPPLRERRDDIPLLVGHFLEILCAEQGRETLKVDPEVLDAFCRYSWPGNVRDLENEMRRLVTFAEDAITLDLVSDRIRRSAAGEAEPGGLDGLGLAEKVEAIERREITEALRLCGGNKSRAARKLKITRFTLQRKLEKYGITGEES